MNRCCANWFLTERLMFWKSQKILLIWYGLCIQNAKHYSQLAYLYYTEGNGHNASIITLKLIFDKISSLNWLTTLSEVSRYNTYYDFALCQIKWIEVELCLWTETLSLIHCQANKSKMMTQTTTHIQKLSLKMNHHDICHFLMSKQSHHNALLWSKPHSLWPTANPENTYFYLISQKTLSQSQERP